MSEKEPQFQHPQPQTTNPAADQIFSFTPSLDEVNTRLQKLEQSVQNKRINLNTDIIGLFQTVSAVPTQIPNNPYQQIQFYSNGTTYRLYVYDAVNNVWRYATLT